MKLFFRIKKVLCLIKQRLFEKNIDKILQKLFRKLKIWKVIIYKKKMKQYQILNNDIAQEILEIGKIIHKIWMSGMIYNIKL